LLNTKSQNSIKQPLARPTAFRSGTLSLADFRPSREHAIPPAQMGTFINATVIGETFCSIPSGSVVVACHENEGA
jgi:hypothetical protein